MMDAPEAALKPASQTELLDLLRTGHERLQGVLASVHPQKATDPGVLGTWSVKDLVAHLAYWPAFLNEQIEAALRHEPVPPSPCASKPDTDRINAQVVEASRGRSWVDVRSDLDRSISELVTTIQSLGEDDLFVPGRFAAIDPGPLWASISGETYEHMKVHLGHIETWLRRAV